MNVCIPTGGHAGDTRRADLLCNTLDMAGWRLRYVPLLVCLAAHAACAHKWTEYVRVCVCVNVCRDTPIKCSIVRAKDDGQYYYVRGGVIEPGQTYRITTNDIDSLTHTHIHTMRCCAIRAGSPAWRHSGVSPPPGCLNGLCCGAYRTPIELLSQNARRHFNVQRGGHFTH